MKKEAAQKVSDNEIINQDINGILVTGRNGRITNNQVEEELEKGFLPDGKIDIETVSRLNQAGIKLHFGDQGIRWFRDQLKVSNPL